MIYPSLENSNLVLKNKYTLIGDSLCSFIARNISENSNYKSFQIPAINHMKDSIPIDRVYQIVNECKFETESAILSLGQHELGLKHVNFRNLRQWIHAILDSLCKKHVKDIIMLMPIPKPNGFYGSCNMKLKKYLKFLSMFRQIARQRSIRCLESPLKIFLNMDQKGRIRQNKRGYLYLNRSAFHYSRKNNRFYPHCKQIENLMKKLIAFHTNNEKESSTIPKKENTLPLSSENTTNMHAIPKPTQQERAKSLTSKIEGSIDHLLDNNLNQPILPDHRSADPQIGLQIQQERDRNIDTQTNTSIIAVDGSRNSSTDHFPCVYNARSDNKNDIYKIERESDLNNKKPQNSITSRELKTNFQVIGINDQHNLQTSTTHATNQHDKENVNQHIIVQAEVHNANVEHAQEILVINKSKNTCVIPLYVENTSYPAQLDTGAGPNVISKDTALTLKKTHPEKIKIEKSRAIVKVQMADGRITNAMNYQAKIQLQFGRHQFTLTFYMLDHCSCVFIIGRYSMLENGIEINLANLVATCYKDGILETLPFLETHQFQGKLKLNQILSIDIQQLTDIEIERLPENTGQNKFKKILIKRLKILVEQKSITLQQSHKAYEKLSNYQDIFRDQLGIYNGSPVKFDLSDTKPWRGPNYRPNNTALKKLKLEQEKMDDQGITSLSDTIYINAVLPRLKKDGSIRICLDPEHLNKKLKNDYNEPPTLDRIITSNFDSKWYTSIDFRNGFWQIPLDEESKKYTGYQIEGTVRQFERLPQGIKTASAEFIKIINKVIPDDERISKYVDDIMLQDDDFEEHCDRLACVFQRVQEHNMTLNPEKLKIFQNETDHLGYLIKKGAVAKQDRKIEAFQKFKEKYYNERKKAVILKTIKHVQKLLGMVNLYRRFMKNYQKMVAPITKLLTKNTPFKWESEQIEAFNALEVEYTKQFELRKPNYKWDFWLEAEVADDTINGVLYQRDNDGQENVVMYVSKTLQQSQKNYTLIEKNMLAMATSLKKLRMWIDGCKIHVPENIKTLKNKFRDLAQTHQRAATWLTILNSFNLIFDIKKSKKSNMFQSQPDELTIQTISKVNNLEQINAIDYKISPSLEEALKNLQKWQNEDKKLKKIIDTFEKQPNQKIEKTYTYENSVLYKNMNDGSKLPMLPEMLFKDVIDHLHEWYNHAGAQKLDQIFNRYYYCANSLKYIKTITNSCLNCKINKVYGSKITGEYASVRADDMGELISVDIFGPLPSEPEKSRFVLVAKDVFSNRIWLKSTIETKVEDCTNLVTRILSDLQTKNVIWKKVVTDNGPQFASDDWKRFCIEKGIKVGYTSAYNPQSSSVERTMREIGTQLRIHLNKIEHDSCVYSHERWEEAISDIENVLNNTPTPHKLTPNQIWQIEEKVDPMANVIRPRPLNHGELIRKACKKIQKYVIKGKNKEEITNEELINPENYLIDTEGYHWVYVDGACRNNGSQNATAGIGICFKPDSKINISQVIADSRYKNTNNLAELIAIKTAMEIAAKAEIKKLKILTDSKYTVLAINERITKWEQNNWKNYNKKPIHHKEIFQDIKKLKDKFPFFQIQHVMGHAYDFSNAIADKLAKMSIYGDQMDDLRNSAIRLSEISDPDHDTKEKIIKTYISISKFLEHMKLEKDFYKSGKQPTKLESGDLVLITTHYLSSRDRGTTSKLYPKRIGPYIIIKKISTNCYQVKNFDTTKSEDIKCVNIRQMTLYLKAEQLKEIEENCRFKSAFAKPNDDRINRQIEEKKRLTQDAEKRQLEKDQMPMQMKIDQHQKNINKIKKMLEENARRRKLAENEKLKRQIEEKVASVEVPQTAVARISTLLGEKNDELAKRMILILGDDESTKWIMDAIMSFNEGKMNGKIENNRTVISLLIKNMKENNNNLYKQITFDWPKIKKKKTGKRQRRMRRLRNTDQHPINKLR